MKKQNQLEAALKEISEMSTDRKAAMETKPTHIIYVGGVKP